MSSKPQPWYRELSHGDKILLTAVYNRRTQTELAVLFVLVKQTGRMCIEHQSHLWLRTLIDRPDRALAPAAPLLPYTRQGISKAVASLVADGWLQQVGERGYASYRDAELRLLDINILSNAPPWLRAAGPVETSVAKVSGSTKKSNKRSKRPRADQPEVTPVASTRSTQRTLSDFATSVTVQVVKGDKYFDCREQGGKGPPAQIPRSSYSMPGAARYYAAKVLSRLLERDVSPDDLRPTHEGAGRYHYTVKGGK